MYQLRNNYRQPSRWAPKVKSFLIDWRATESLELYFFKSGPVFCRLALTLMLFSPFIGSNTNCLVFSLNHLGVAMLTSWYFMTSLGSRDGALMRALASHQYVPGSIPGPGVICQLSLLLVLFSALRGFCSGTPVFPSPQKPTFSNSKSSLEGVPN